MMRFPVNVLFTIATVWLFLAASCVERYLLKTPLDDELKPANDRYLEELGTYLEQNDQKINLSAPLRVNFDRYINLAIQNSDGVTTVLYSEEAFLQTLKDYYVFATGDF